MGGAWAYYIYFAFGKQLFADGHMPGLLDVLEQIKVPASFVLNACLPVFLAGSPVTWR